MTRHDSEVNVLIVDDEPDSVSTLGDILANKLGVSVTTRYPTDIGREDLQRASLVIVDFVLKNGPWTEHDRFEIGRQPKNGLALAGVLRSHVDNRFDTETRPKAFALLTAEVDRLAYHKPLLDHRLHSLARLNDLEWVFNKQDDAYQNARAIASLAKAVHRIITAGFQDATTKPRAVAELFGLPADAAKPDSETWESRAWTTVLDAYPPINDYYEESTGFSLVRWLLQRALPFICFLLPDFAVAARLNVTKEWLRNEVEVKSAFGTELEKYKYQGLLHDFGLSHYWRIGVEETLGSLGISQPLDWKVTHQQLAPHCNAPPVPTGLAVPIAVLNKHLLYTGTLADLEACDQLSPDDWPAFADAPYAPTSLIESDDGLQTLKVTTP